MKIRNLIDEFITKIKGEDFVLDKNIPLSYLAFFLLQKTCFLIVGICRFRIMGRYFVHPSSKIKCSSKIRMGKNLNIDRNCYIDALSINGIQFGNNVSVGKNTTIECSGTLKDLGKGLKVGDNVGLGTHGFFGCAGGIEIGDNTIFGNFVSMHSENHNFSDHSQPIRLQGVNRKGIKIGSDCWIGAKVTVLDGTVIGNGCIVAAGAVVRGQFPENVILGGVPAKIIKQRFS